MNRKLTSRDSTPWAKGKSFYATLLCTVLLGLLILVSSAHAQHLTGRIKGTVKVTTEATDAPPPALVGARLTLINRDLPEQVFKFRDLPLGTHATTLNVGSKIPTPYLLPKSERRVQRFFPLICLVVSRLS